MVEIMLNICKYGTGALMGFLLCKQIKKYEKPPAIPSAYIASRMIYVFIMASSTWLGVKLFTHVTINYSIN